VTIACHFEPKPEGSRCGREESRIVDLPSHQLMPLPFGLRAIVRLDADNPRAIRKSAPIVERRKLVTRKKA